MRNLLLGLIIGFVIAVATASYAASVLGSGYLMGWYVTHDGEAVCVDPYVWIGIKEIDC